MAEESCLVLSALRVMASQLRSERLQEADDFGGEV